MLSSAYWHGSPLMRKIGGDEYVNVKAENDWTVQEEEFKTIAGNVAPYFR